MRAANIWKWYLFNEKDRSMSDSNHDDDDNDMFGVVALVAKILDHALRMAGRHGMEVDEAKIGAVVKAILEKEDCWTFDSDLSQAIMAMLELPLALGAYNEPLDLVLSNEVANQIDLQRADAQVADRRATLHVLRRPTPDKPKR
jgi:hypothetical protein